MNGDAMKCPRCLAQDDWYFYGGVCRRCIHLKNAAMEEERYYGAEDVTMDIGYQLTVYQKEMAEKICAAITQGDVFVEAVCGAGKTEMCLQLIQESLVNQLRIGWAIPRRQVVLELAQRLARIFPHLRITPVCAGYTECVEGDLIICTTHQLFRYHRYFDVLVVDEPDAYPFSGNDFLFDLMKASVCGHIVYLSATVDERLRQDIARGSVCHLRLPMRPCGRPLPVPVVYKGFFIWVKLLTDLRRHRQDSCLIFVPTRSIARRLSFLLQCDHITSESEDKDEIIRRFRSRSSGLLVCTTVLERGVTFVDCMVFVALADHVLFDSSSLIQIAGRVKRGLDSTKGVCYFYCASYSPSVESCIKAIVEANHDARFVLNRS